MSDYSQTARFLVFFLIPLFVVFIVGFGLHAQDLWVATFVVILIVIVVIAILVRWGDGLGPTD